MDLFQAIETRRSIRAYSRQPVHQDDIRRIIKAALRAPSAGNLQAYEIFQVEDNRALRLLARAALDQLFIAEAPVALVFFANPARSAVRYRRRGESLYCLQDATIACAYAQLAAHALGLGSVWVGAFDDRLVIEAVGADRAGALVPVAILPIGHPAESPEATSRRRWDEIVHRIR